MGCAKGVVLQANFTLVGDYINLATDGLWALGAIMLARRYIRCWRPLAAETPIFAAATGATRQVIATVDWYETLVSVFYRTRRVGDFAQDGGDLRGYRHPTSSASRASPGSYLSTVSRIAPT